MQTADSAEVLSGNRRWAVLNTDSLQFMRSLPDGSVDAIITDPPYGISKQYAGGKEVGKDAASYWAWYEPFYREIERVVKPGGLIAMWQTQLYFRHFWDWYGDDIHIYAGAKNFIQIRQVDIQYAYDPIVMRFKPGAKALRLKKPRRSFDFFVANTAKHLGPRKNKYLRGHPCPRPLDQCVEIVENFTLPNAVILDPFAGAGTIGVAALQAGRRYIGVEIAEQYAEACARPWLLETENSLHANDTHGQPMLIEHIKKEN